MMTTTTTKPFSLKQVGVGVITIIWLDQKVGREQDGLKR
jgi:hypothetical protein